MIIIRFPNEAAKGKALECLPGQFSCKSWATGEMMVPEEALSFLTLEGVPYTVEGPATYEHHLPTFRGTPAAAVQR